MERFPLHTDVIIDVRVQVQWQQLEKTGRGVGRSAKIDGWQRVGSGIMLPLLVRVSNVLIFPLALNLCPG